jgi:hypothetical protein
MPYFVPLRGWDESESDEAIDAVYVVGAGGNAYSGYHEAGGRDTLADSPLSYIANLAQSAIVFKEKNDAKRFLFDLAARAKQPDLMQPKMGFIIETAVLRHRGSRRAGVARGAERGGSRKGGG